MKFSTTSSLVALGLLMSAPVMAQMNHTMPMGHSMPPMQTANTTVAAADAAAMGEGLVKNINKAKGTVTLQHGTLPNGMPPMTMAYKVKDKAMLDSLKAGKKIRFATDPADGGMTVTKIEQVK